MIGPDCVIGDGVRIQGSTLLEGVSVDSHSIIKQSIIGWRSRVGKWVRESIPYPHSSHHTPDNTPPPHASLPAHTLGTHSS